jgi:uncharacterized protein YmfQ (DUF2313 family)
MGVKQVTAQIDGVDNTVVSWFADGAYYPPRTYTITYLSGAYNWYHGNPGYWGMGAVITDGAGNDVVFAPAPTFGDPVINASQASVEAYFGDPSRNSIAYQHKGGKIGVRTYDGYTGDNTHGAPDPVFGLPAPATGRLSQADYGDLIIQLLPRGLAWRGQRLWALVQAFAGECARVDAQAVTLVTEAFPQTTEQCLPDWERIAGIPSAAWPAVVPSTNITQRQKLLLAKLSAQGGQSKSYLEAVAARIGYTISSITDGYVPFAAGVGYAGAPIYSAWWAFTFTVHVSALPTGETVTYDPAAPTLRQHTNARLEGVINSLQPAHTISLYTYP